MNIKLYHAGLIVTAVLALGAVLLAVNFSTQLNTTRNQLTISENNLRDKQTELTSAQNDLSATQLELKNTADNLTLTQGSAYLDA